MLILAGGIASGKTTTCQRLTELARQEGLRIGGVLELAIYDEAGRKVGIRALDLASGEARMLARSDQELGGPSTEHYGFNEEALTWARQAVERALPCDLLILDEIGPLELEDEKGLAALRALPLEAARNVLLVVRETLAERLATLLPQKAMLFRLDEQTREDIPRQILDTIMAEN